MTNFVKLTTTGDVENTPIAIRTDLITSVSVKLPSIHNENTYTIVYTSELSKQRDYRTGEFTTTPYTMYKVTETVEEILELLN